MGAVLGQGVGQVRGGPCGVGCGSCCEGGGGAGWKRPAASTVLLTSFLNPPLPSRKIFNLSSQWREKFPPHPKPLFMDKLYVGSLKLWLLMLKTKHLDLRKKKNLLSAKKPGFCKSEESWFSRLLSPL